MPRHEEIQNYWISTAVKKFKATAIVNLQCLHVLFLTILYH